MIRMNYFLAIKYPFITLEKYLWIKKLRTIKLINQFNLQIKNLSFLASKIRKLKNLKIIARKNKINCPKSNKLKAPVMNREPIKIVIAISFKMLLIILFI